MKTGRYKIVKELSNRGLFSIDIGCKYSKFAEISIDIDPSVSPTIIADARYLPIKDNIFERVYLLDIIEHLPKNTEKKTLLEINRILKKNGELIITTPNDYWLFTLTDPAWYLLGHRHYKKELLLKMIKDVGFNIETCFTRGGFWAEIFALWYYLITYPFKFKTPKYIVDKENKEYEKYKKNGFTIFVKAKKMHHKRNNELSKFGVYGILNCVVSSYKVVSGGDTSFIEICRRLDRRGHGICIHTTEDGYEMCKNNGLNVDYKIISSHTSEYKQDWGGEFWSDGGYVGTVGEGVTTDIIRNYIETQGTPEEKENYSQMKLLDFEQSNGGTNHAPLLAAWMCQRNLTNGGDIF